MKRVLILLAALALLLTVFAAGCLADIDYDPVVEDNTEKGYSGYYDAAFDGWNFSDGTLTLTKNPTGDYQTGDTRPWKDIVGQVRRVEFGPDVTYIGYHAFSGCTELTEAALPCADVAEGLFMDCVKLKRVSVHYSSADQYTTVHAGAFKNCSSLETFSADRLAFVDYNAFENCSSLRSLTFSTLLIRPHINSWAFRGCTQLSQISFADCIAPDAILDFSFSDVTATVIYPDYFSWRVFQKSNFGGNITWEKVEPTVTTIQGDLGNTQWTLALKEGLLTISGIGDVHMNTEPDGKDNRGWIPYAMEVRKAVFENGVTSVPRLAFDRFESLEEIELADTVLTIGSSAFKDCFSLNTIKLPEGMTEIGGAMFNGCGSLTHIDIPSTVRTIGAGAFEGCSSLEEVVIPDSVEIIGAMAFWGCGAKKITLGKGITTIADRAFQACLYTPSITIPASVKRIGSSFTFYGTDELRFLGDAPEIFVTEGFLRPFGAAHDDEGDVTTCYYPADNDTWSELIKNDYRGSVVWVPDTVKASIADCEVVLDQIGYVYSGNACTPGVSVALGMKRLTQDTDYTVAYTDNVKAGTATVIVTGKGSYTGSQTAEFAIAKAEPTLTFAEISVNVKSSDAAFTNAIDNPMGCRLTYSSSNASVAAVDEASGRVTVKNPGTAVITATAAESENYTAAVASYSLYVADAPQDPVTLADLTYSLTNSASSLGYNSGYVIPLSSYLHFYSEAQAKMLIASQKNRAWGGSCYGFSSSSTLFNNDDSGLALSKFGAKKVSNLKTSSYGNVYGMNVRTLLEALQVSWNKTSGICFPQTNLNDLVSEVEKGAINHTLPVIAVYGAGGKPGHALVGYKVEKSNAKTSYLYVYDCNYPNKTRRITLTTDADGNYINWSYKINDIYNCGWSYEGSMILYVPYAQIRAVWNSRNGVAPNTNMLTVNAKSYDICDYAGNVLAEMRDGVFTSFRSSIAAVVEPEATGDPSRTVINLPPDVYQVIGRDGNSNFEATMVNVKQTAQVHTDSGNIVFAVIDRDDCNEISIDTREGESYYVQFSSDLASAQGKEEIVFSGMGNGAFVTLGLLNGEFVMSGCTGVSMAVNGELVTLPDSDNMRDLADYPLRLQYTQAVYTGELIRPAVIVDEGYNFVEGTDYNVTYSDNLQVGTAKAVIEGIGSYKGKVELSFKIVASVDELCPDGHTWDRGIVTRMASFNQDGLRTYTCTVCGATKKSDIKGIVWQMMSTGDGRTVILTNETDVLLIGRLCLAGYDAQGRMTALSMTDVSVEGQHSTQTTLTLTPDTERIKAFVLEESTLTPVCPYWEGK